MFCLFLSLSGKCQADDRLWGHMFSWPCSPSSVPVWSQSDASSTLSYVTLSLPAYWTAQALFGMAELILVGVEQSFPLVYFFHIYFPAAKAHLDIPHSYTGNCLCVCIDCVRSLA